MTRLRRTFALVLLAATACTSSVAVPTRSLRLPSDDPRPRRVFAAGPSVSSVGLEPVGDCRAFEDKVRAEAVRRAGPYGVEGLQELANFHGDLMMMMPSTAEAPTDSGVDGVAQAAPMAVPAGGAAKESYGGAPGSYSTTNVQEEGVDEPDIVKTDGERILAIAGNRLRSLVLRGGKPVLRDSLALPDGSGHQVLFAGDRALVITPSAGEIGRGVPQVWRNRERTTILVVDVSDPARLGSLATLHLQGAYVSARMIGGVARLVLRARPDQISFITPADSSASALRSSTRRNRRIAASLDAEDFRPDYLMVDRRGPKSVRKTGTLASCDQVASPKQFSGFGMISVVTVDPMHPEPRDGVSVLGDAQTIYASPERLYVATTRYPEQQQPVPAPGGAASTALHSFDITGTGPARYLASGSVDGTVLNQFSLSEHEGRLRVATTVQRFGGSGESSESFVSVLTQSGPSLNVTAKVGNLGQGERIYAVRFMGDRGYVVTFRQVDPLYVLDLSDPANPRVTGELKIPGFSSYLHPVGDGLLLGIGKEADDQGRVTATQVSLFDVSDPAKPQRLAQHVLGSGQSEAEQDHHAFLWWPSRRLAVVPYQSWDLSSGGVSFSGAVGMTVGESTIAEAGRLAHPAAQPDQGLHGIRRAFVAGDMLLTLSEAGLMGSSLDALKQTAWLAWPTS